MREHQRSHCAFPRDAEWSYPSLAGPCPTGPASPMAVACSAMTLGLDGRCKLHTGSHRDRDESASLPTPLQVPLVHLFRSSSHASVVTDWRRQWVSSYHQTVLEPTQLPILHRRHRSRGGNVERNQELLKLERQSGVASVSRMTFGSLVPI